VKHASRWTPGNHFTLLENGEAFFPAVFDAIAHAEREVLIETFILFEDKVGLALHAALVAAGRRGVQIDVLVDGFGSPNLSTKFIDELTSAGVRLRVFDPQRPLLGLRVNWFRRMHRKIVVVDGTLAFVGGINFSADHLEDFGPEAKQDYAVEVRGPLVTEIHRFAREAIKAPAGPRTWFARARPNVLDEQVPKAGDAQAMFVTRDNNAHRDDIERHYRVAIRAARQRVVIANAYFFPGYRLLRELRRAARRGVDVRLILQGEPDMKIVKAAAELLYDHLQAAGVKIYEYCKRPLHGKVALVDDEWSTVGSSNLDPLSLSLNLEANVMIRDRAFNAHLHAQLSDLIEHCCKEIEPPPERQRNVWLTVRSFVVFHFLRRFPAWAGWFPAHRPVLAMPQAHADPQDAMETRSRNEVLGHGG
jgi:cardiolipin synthase